MNADEFIDAVVKKLEELRVDEEARILKRMCEEVAISGLVFCKYCENCYDGWCTELGREVAENSYCWMGVEYGRGQVH